MLIGIISCRDSNHVSDGADFERNREVSWCPYECAHVAHRDLFETRGLALKLVECRRNGCEDKRSITCCGNFAREVFGGVDECQRCAWDWLPC